MLISSVIYMKIPLNVPTWGNPEGAKEKDELDKHIETQSAKIGYFVNDIVRFNSVYL